MSKQVLLVHGGGGGAADADARLATQLRDELGDGYHVRYPTMPHEEEPDYRIWKKLILEEIADMGEGAILVGHSISASVLIRIFADGMPRQRVAGLFLIASPFWHDDKVWHWDEVRLPADVGQRIPRELPLHLYQGEDDEVVPIAHLDMYAKALPHAVIRRLPGRDHQIANDMSEVARDIESLG